MGLDKDGSFKPEWEELEDENRNMRTWRMRVDGGYIYRMMDFNNNTHAMFVPNSPIPDSRIENEVQALKMAFANFIEQRTIDVNQFNKNIQDSAINHAQLYAKVNDIRMELTRNIDSLIKSCNFLVERIDKLESSQLTQAIDPQVWKHVEDRLDILEQMYQRFKIFLESPATASLFEQEIFKRLSDIEFKLKELETRYNFISNPSEVSQIIEKIKEKIQATQAHVKECVHDWDYSRVLTSMPPKYQCKKCGAYSKPTDFTGVTL